MARIILADDGVVFDGHSASTGAIGGAEGAVVALAEALAARGHQVAVYNRCAAPVDHAGVAWRPLGDLPESADLYIANRSHHLIGLVPAAKRRLFWLHNPAGYILKPRYLWPLWRWRPILVFAGPHHAGTCPGWVPEGGRVEIPLGIDPVFGHLPERSAPAPIAVFASNPLRGLDWLLARWSAIRTAVPAARLIIHAGAATYRGGADRHGARIEAVLTQARGLAASGVEVHPPVDRAALAERYSGARAMLYRGDEGETFCLALAEAQAAGVPAVVGRLGAVPERVIDGVTGTVADDERQFEAAAIRLLSDDALWLTQHRACRAEQRGLSWQTAAQAFEAA